MEIATTKQNEALYRIFKFLNMAVYTDISLTKKDLEVLNQFILLTSFGTEQNQRVNQTDLANNLYTNISTINRSIKKLINTNLIIKENEKYSLNCEKLTGIKKRRTT